MNHKQRVRAVLAGHRQAIQGLEAPGKRILSSGEPVWQRPLDIYDQIAQALAGRSA